VGPAEPLCPACGWVQPLRGNEDLFSVLGLPRTLEPDLKAAEGRFYELSRRLHPDRFGKKPEQMENAMQRSALLNDAWRTMRDPAARLDYFLGLEEKDLTIPAGASAGAKAQVPAELAEDYFEMQEALMDGESGALRKISDRLEALEADNREAVRRLSARWEAGGLESPETRAGNAALRREIAAELRMLKTTGQYLYRMREDIRRRTGG